MGTLQPCPCCLSDVDFIKIEHSQRVEQRYHFLIRCNHCGKSTSQTYASKTILAAIWNAMVMSNPNAYND